MAWTDKMVEDLRIMWKQGLTTGEIAKRLEVSKNSVVGKVHRLQLDARPSPIKRKDDTPSEAEKTVEKDNPKTVEEEKPVEVKKTPLPEPKKNEPAKIEPAKPEAKITCSKISAPEKTYNGNAKLTDLDNHTCRWPLGDPKDENFHFCGRKVRTGQTYCEEHAALAYVKPTQKK